jgi:hypothetical protein
MALSSNGTVSAWGADWNGQCDISATVSNAVGIAAGEEHTLVLVDQGIFVPRLFKPAWNGNQFSALIQTFSPRTYILEFKSSLTATNWTAFPGVPGNGTLKVLKDTNATVPQRFYHARQQ